jgi:Protein of unknown function (DUF2867)
MTSVERVAPAGLALSALDRVDYADAFEISVGPGLPNDPDWWWDRMLSDPPTAIALALRFRNAVVRPLGLASGSLRRLPVLARTDEESVIGLDDRHLDFRAAVRVHDRRLRMTTAVRFHGLAGRAYFLPVRPVHSRLVVPGMLRRAARN